MTKARSNAVANAAKGDLTVGNGTDLSGILAVGSNGDTLVADSSAATGLNYTAIAGQNFCINGSLDFWQRGTSVSGAGVAPYYGADRWQVYRGAAVTGATFSRQDGTGAGFNYCYRLQRDSGNTSTNNLFMSQSFETSISRNLQGQFLTLSFWARKGANYSATTDAVVRIVGGTGTDQTIANGFTGETVLGQLNIRSGDITTSWVRYTVTTTAAVANTVTQIGLYYNIIPVGTAGAADFIEIAGIKLEIGKAATSFTRAGGTIQGELAACQRYYQRVTGRYGYVGTGTANSSTDVLFQMALPVQMRIAPTALSVSALGDWKLIPGNKSISAFNLAAPKTSIGSFYVTSTGLSANQSWTLYPEGNTNGDNSFIDFTAEL
jgi:hypothetical protein